MGAKHVSQQYSGSDKQSSSSRETSRSSITSKNHADAVQDSADAERIGNEKVATTGRPVAGRAGLVGNVGQSGADGAEEGAGGNTDHPPSVVEELLTYEAQMNHTLQANRALVEAYWRVRMLVEEASRLGQAVALPTHDELMLTALVEKSNGRRSLPSELEKSLAREKETLELQLTRSRAELCESQMALQQAMSGLHRDQASAERDLAVIRQRAAAETLRADDLAERLELLESAVSSKDNDKLLRQLRRSQDDLVEQLAVLQREASAGDLSVSTISRGQNAPVPHLCSKDDRCSTQNDARVLQLKADKEALREELKNFHNTHRELQSRLCETDARPKAANCPVDTDAQAYALKVHELTKQLQALERERSELQRRAFAAEEQRDTIQAYVDAHMWKMQKELIELKDGHGAPRKEQ